MNYAVLFPGQGSQTVGMGADVRAQRPDLFGERAEGVLGWDLDAMIDDGPQERLTETQFAQPALYATSFALWDEFRQQVDRPPTAAAGHSLGEYTALAAAGAFSYEAGLALVGERGSAMAECAGASPSGMAALLGADDELAESIAAQRRHDGGELYVANYNSPGQIVLAGGTDDIRWLSENAKELGVRRAIALDVAAGFHSPFMAPARERLDTALASARFDGLAFPVVANATGEPVADVASALSEQLTAPVRFAQSLVTMADLGVEVFIHIGPGDVTAGLAKRTVKGTVVHAISSLEDVPGVVEAVSVQ